VTDKDGKVIKPAVSRHVSMTSVAVGKELPFALIFMTHMNIDFDGAANAYGRTTRSRSIISSMVGRAHITTVSCPSFRQPRIRWIKTE
jgi:hypothetical protein